MIGTFRKDFLDVHIIGGGISGLILAFLLGKKGYQVRLFEKSSRFGGHIQTVQTEEGLAETAIHSFMSVPEIDKLAEELGVDLIEKNPTAKKKFLLINGQTMSGVPPLWVWIDILSRWLVPYFGSVRSDQLSSTAYFRRFFGPWIADRWGDALITGVFANDPNAVQLGFAFPDFPYPRFAEPMIWSVIKVFIRRMQQPRKVIKTAKLGMQQWVDCLVARCAEMKNVTLIPNCAWDGGFDDSVNTILAIPPLSIPDHIAQHHGFERSRQELVFSPIQTMTLFLNRDSFTEIPNGVGALSPSRWRKQILGVLFNSSQFEGRVAQAGLESFTVLFRGTADEVWPEIVDFFVENYGYKGSIKAAPAVEWRSPFPAYGEPLRRFHGDLSALVDLLNVEERNPVAFAGNAYGALSFRSMLVCYMQWVDART